MYAAVLLLRCNTRYAIGGSMAKSARSEGSRIEMSRLVHDVASMAGRSSKQELYGFGRRNGWERHAFVARGDGPWGVREGCAGWFGVCVDSIGLLRQSLGVASKCQTWSYALWVPYGIKGGIHFGLDLLT
jgi:hypothetical protein